MLCFWIIWTQDLCSTFVLLLLVADLKYYDHPCLSKITDGYSFQTTLLPYFYNVIITFNMLHENKKFKKGNNAMMVCEQVGWSKAYQDQLKVYLF